MQLGRKLLQRIKLASKAGDKPDVFDLRLARIGSREARVILRRALFRKPPRPQEA